MPPRLRFDSVIVCALTALLLAGCNGEQPDKAEATEVSAPAVVAVIEAKPETVTIADELPGRVIAFRSAEIRPQVSGIIQKRLFEQGSEVDAGQALFQINSAPFKADVDSAAAALQRARAALVRVQAKYDRSRQLVESNAVSRDSHDNAVADLAQAKATVAEALAMLQRRELDLEFATIRAPIAGRIGPALSSEGVLVSTATNVLATIQQIDQVYIDVRQPASQLDVIREALASGQLAANSELPVAIYAASGKPYPVAGRALFSDISVDPATGNLTVRVLVQNPDRLLLPGMYVRAQVPRGVLRNALLVPQEAVVRDLTGRAQLVIVSDGISKRRHVELGDLFEGRYIVRTGLEPGETVIVQGQERIQDGGVVKVVAYAQAVAQANTRAE